MKYNKTLEEGLKEFDEWANGLRLKKGQELYNPEAPITFLKSFLTTFAEKIREGVVEEMEKLRKDSDKFVPFQKIHYQSALDDLLDQIKNPHQ